MFWYLYNFLFHVVYTAMLPYFLWRMRRRGGYRKGFGQRVFRLSEEDHHRVSDGRKVWVHAVSVGEFSLAWSFMSSWREKHPEAQFLVTVNTSTAHTIAEEKMDLSRDVLLYPPVDSPWVIRKVLNTVDVQGLVLVETEMWPNLLRKLNKKNIPVFLLNGRISDRSFRRLKRVPFYTRRLYKLVTLYAMQSEADAQRARGLGAPVERVKVMHSAKYDMAERDVAGEESRRHRLLDCGFLKPDSRILLGSSTWPGEEGVLMDFYKKHVQDIPGLRLILVPRHFERRQEVMEEAQSRKLKLACWSSCSDHQLGEADVLLVDTTGELRHFTGLADRVFIGKSLYRDEGQNPLEAAQAGKYLVTGPGMHNFRRIMQDLKQAEAVQVARDADELCRLLAASFSNPEASRQQGERAHQLVQRHKGSISRSVEAFTEKMFVHHEDTKDTKHGLR